VIVRDGKPMLPHVQVCVQTTMREANDRGFDCLLVSDATASYTPAFKKATLEMVVSQVSPADRTAYPTAT
jgi:biuret amidohydrolase